MGSPQYVWNIYDVAYFTWLVPVGILCKHDKWMRSCENK